MTEELADRSRWAWDTAPTDGSYPGPVYIGDMEDWSPEETKIRYDTNQDPWGGKWTQPLRKGATKAKWGTKTFDSGRYRCCDDLHDCGVFVSVAQGPQIQWHFKRQWKNGKHNSKPHNEKECRNGSRYKGPYRFHNIVVNELYNHFRQTYMLGQHTLSSIRKEPKFNVRPKDGEPFVFEPDIYLELTDGSWYTIEVIDSNPPKRRVHEYCGLGLIEINLKELDCYGDNREFSKWVQGGGVQKILDFEFNSIQRRRRWGARDKKWKGKDERDLRVLEGHISKCKKAYGFDLDFDLESTSIEQVTLAFQEEVAKRERIKKAERDKELEAKKARAKLLTEIYNAVQRNIEKYGERIPRASGTYSSPSEVDRIYSEHFTKKAEDEKRRGEIQAEEARCEELYGFKLDNVYLLNLSGPEAVKPYFEKKKARIELEIRLENNRLAGLKAIERETKKAEARVQEWREVGYSQAIKKFEEEFELTEEEVGVDSSFNLEEIREAFQWLTAQNKKDRRKNEEDATTQSEKEEQRIKAKSTVSESTNVKKGWSRGPSEDEMQFRKVMKEIQQKHGRHKTLDYFSGWTEKELWSFHDAQAEEEKARQEQKKADAKRDRRQEKATREMERRILARSEKDALAQETNNALEAIETRSGKDRERYWKLKKDLEQGANDESFSAERREAQQAALDKLIENEGQKWGDPDAS